MCSEDTVYLSCRIVDHVIFTNAWSLGNFPYNLWFYLIILNVYVVFPCYDNFAMIILLCQQILVWAVLQALQLQSELTYSKLGCDVES